MIFHRCDHSRCDTTIEVLRSLVDDLKRQVMERDRLLLDMHGEGVENESRRLQMETHARLSQLGIEYQIRGAKPITPPAGQGNGGPGQPEAASPLDDDQPPPMSESAHVTGKVHG